MKSFLFILCMLSGPAYAGVGLGFYGAFPVGFSEMNETVAPQTYSHSSDIDVGFLAGFKFGWFGSPLEMGILGEYGFLSYNMSRLLTAGGAPVSPTRYNFETQRLLGGGFVGVPLGAGFRVQAEYYPYFDARVSYSEQKSANPFLKGDHLSGYGFGVGLGFAISFIDISTTWRFLYANKFKLSGATTNLPSTRYSKFHSNEIVTSFGVRF